MLANPLTNCPRNGPLSGSRNFESVTFSNTYQTVHKGVKMPRFWASTSWFDLVMLHWRTFFSVQSDIYLKPPADNCPGIQFHVTVYLGPISWSFYESACKVCGSWAKMVSATRKLLKKSSPGEKSLPGSQCTAVTCLWTPCIHTRSHSPWTRPCLLLWSCS